MSMRKYWETDWLDALRDWLIPPARFDNPTAAPVLTMPYRAKIHHAPDGEKVSVSIPCTRLYWSAAAPTFLVFGIPPILTFATVLGSGFNYRTGPTWHPFYLLIALVICFFILRFLIRLGFPRIVIEATREGVKVGGFTFEWGKVGGLRKGSSGGMKYLGNTTLRMQYGAWGFELPYAVNNGMLEYYIIWANDMLGTVKHVPDHARRNDPQSGFIKQIF